MAICAPLTTVLLLPPPATGRRPASKMEALTCQLSITIYLAQPVLCRCRLPEELQLPPVGCCCWALTKVQQAGLPFQHCLCGATLTLLLVLSPVSLLLLLLLR